MDAGSKHEFVISATVSCSSTFRAPLILEQLRLELRHHVCGLEARVRDLINGELLVKVQGGMISATESYSSTFRAPS